MGSPGVAALGKGMVDLNTAINFFEGEIPENVVVF